MRGLELKRGKSVLPFTSQFACSSGAAQVSLLAGCLSEGLLAGAGGERGTPADANFLGERGALP